jgi:hypothetical protein
VEIPEAAVVAADGLIRLAPMKKEALAFVFTPEFRAEEVPFTMVPGREFGASIMPLLGPVWLFYIWITFFSF